MVRGMWQQNIEVTWYFSTTLGHFFRPVGHVIGGLLTVDGVTPPIYCLT